MLDSFINYLNRNANVSIYVRGAQGTGYFTKPQLSDEWILKHDDTKKNALIAIDLFHKRIKEGLRKQICAFDCSGLGMYWLMENGIYKSDMTANGMKGKCEKIAKSALKRGDWVFRIDSTGRAYHIGYVVDDKKTVIEAKSHKDGVVKRAINASGSTYWNYFGRPKCFKEEIEKEVEPEMKTYKKRAKAKIKPIYNENGVVEKGRFIAKNDVCVLTNIVTENCLIPVEYPLSTGGTHKAYIKDISAF